MNEPRKDKNGTTWNFRVWHEVINSGHVVRIFFWDEKREHTGVVLLPGEANTHVSRLRQTIQKLVASASLRHKYQRELQFPLERHYDEYGAFPEELP